MPHNNSRHNNNTHIKIYYNKVICHQTDSVLIRLHVHNMLYLSWSLKGPLKIGQRAAGKNVQPSLMIIYEKSHQ